MTILPLMGDPLSVTAGVIAVLQLTEKLLGYITTTKNASKEQTQVAIEASNVYGLLTTLRFRVQAASIDDPWFQQIKLMNAEDGPLDQLKRILQKMVAKMESANKLEDIKNALRWKFTRTEMMEALNHIERLKSLVQLALTNDLL